MGSLPCSRFLDATQRSPKRTFGGALCDIQKTALRETIKLGEGSYKRKLTLFGDMYHEVSGSFHLQI